MESFGQYLKSLREEKGVTLEQIAENTKIAVPNLDSIEKDRYDLLPPRVFVKGFIRSYLQELDIPAGEILEKFEEVTEHNETVFFSEEDRMVFNKPPNSLVNHLWFSIALSLAGIASFFILSLTIVTKLTRYDARQTAPTFPLMDNEQDSPATSGTARQKVAESSDATDFGDVAQSGGKRFLEVTAVANTFVRVEPDDGRAEDLVMRSGDVRSFTARKNFHIFTGNAGGIRLRLDDKPLPQYGKMNQPISITVP
jgi:cytoskeleton protein RodZ